MTIFKKVINFGKNKIKNQKFILNKKNKIIFNNSKNDLKLIKGHKIILQLFV